MQRNIDYPDNAWVAVPVNFGPYNDYWVVHFNNYNVKKFVKISVKVAEAVIQAFASNKAADDVQHDYPTLSIIAHGHGLTGNVAGNTITGGTVTSFTLKTSGPEGVASTTISGFTPQKAVTFFNHMMEQPTDYGYVISLVAGDTVARVQKGTTAGAYFDTGAGNDTVTGGAGNDTALKWNPGNFTYDGGRGSDLLQLQPMESVIGAPTATKGAVIDLRTGKGENPFGGVFKLKSVENVIGTSQADTINGNDAANTIGDGRYDIGADRVHTFGGNDTVRWGFGETGAFADGGGGSDTLQFVLTAYDASKHHELNLADASKNRGIFAYNTAKNFENLIQSTDLMPSGVSVNFTGNDAANTVSLYVVGRVSLAGGNDSFYEHGAKQTVDGGTGTDHFHVADIQFGKANVLDLENAKQNSGSFAGSVYRNFEVFHSDTAFAWTFRGTRGTQTFIGNDGDETALGRAGDDVLKGFSGNDVLDGGDGKDTLSGGAWADILKGGAGNDVIDGGREPTVGSFREDDIAVYSGRAANYHATFAKGVVTIKDMRSGSPDGTDTVSNVESFRFADKTVSMADLIGQGPSIKGGASHVYSVKEGVSQVVDLQSTDTFGDKEGHGLTYSIIPSIYAHGTEDGFDFTIDAKTGKLAFKTKPDFEKPADENHDNVYNVIVRVTDSHGVSDSQNITVKVTNVAGRAVEAHADFAEAAMDTISHHDMMM